MKYAKSMKKRKAMLYAMVSSALLFQAPEFSYAEEPDQFSFDQVVVTASRVPTKVSQTAANVTVVTREQIEKGPYLSLSDVLRDVNGVIIGNSKGFQGASQAVLLNGDDRVLIMVDGRKIGRPEGIGSGRAGVDLSTIVSLDNIDHIEIVKGGASALYGSDAVGGVINIITRKGVENEITLNMLTGSWGQHQYGLNMQGTENGLSWYVTTVKKHQDHSEYNVLNPALTPGSNKGDTYQWPNSKYDGEGLTVRLDKAIDDNRSWTFNFEHASDEGGQPYSLSTASDAISSHLYNNAALTYNFAQKSAVPGFARIYTNYNDQDFYGLYKSRTSGLQYQTGWVLNEANKLIAGVDWEKGEVLEGPNGYNHKSVTDTAVYLQDIYDLNDKWTVTPGVRYDHHSKFGGQATPKVSVNYSVDKNTNLYASYNRVFKAPNLDDLYYDTYYYKGNPDLKPEKGYVTSVGVNKKLNDRTQMTASYFTSEISNAIHWYPDDPTDTWNSVWRAYNITNEKKHGFELDINHKFSEKYYADLGYSYVHVEQQGDNYGLIRCLNSQPNGYRVKLGYGDAKWAVNISGQGISGRDTNFFVDSSCWIWDMAVNYKIDKKTLVYINAFNLTNKAYEITPSVSSYDVAGDYPMPARNIQFGVKYSL